MAVRKRKKAYINFSYWCILLAMVLLLCGSICFEAFQVEKCENIKPKASDIGVVSQIMVTIILFVGTAITLFITIYREQYFGISVSEFNRLRGKQHFSVLSVILLSIILSVASIVSWALEYLFLCIAINTIIFVFSIYICITEIPIMLKSENALFKIIKRHIIINYDKKNYSLIPAMNRVLSTLITKEHDILTTYNLLKSKDNDYNKYLLLILLDRQEDDAFELKGISDVNEQKARADTMMRNIKQLINAKLDIFSVLEGDCTEHTFRLSRVLFRLLELPSHKSAVADYIAYETTLLDYIEDEQKLKFMIKLILAMYACSLTKEDFSILEALRMELSRYNRFGDNRKLLSAIFSIISLHLYYLGNNAPNVSEDFKNKINTFIHYTGTENNTKITAWKNLLHDSIYEFTIDFPTLYKLFRLSEHNWDVPINNIEAHFVETTDKYLVEWFFACLFQSHRVSEFDYNILKVNQEIIFVLKTLGDDLCNGPSSVTLTKNMKNMALFFEINEKNYRWVEIDEENTQHFAKFLSNLHLQDLEAKILEASKVSAQDMADTWKTLVIKKISSEFGFDVNITMDSEVRYLNIILEKCNYAVNYDQVVVDAIVNSIICDIARTITKTEISTQKNFDEIFDKISIASDIYVSKYFYYSVVHDLSPKQQETLSAIVKSATAFTSRILHGNIISIGKPFDFNFKISQMVALPLTNEQLYSKVDEYKKDNGQYAYEGAILDRAKLMEIIKQQFFILHIEIQHSTTVCGEIYDVDFDESK